MANRAAIIDLGTNTFHLLIFEWEGKRYTILDKVQIPVKLGSGAFETNTIKPEAFERGVAALRQFKELLDTENIQMVETFGTSALRNTSNASEFIQTAEEILGTPLQVIAGDKEAELIHEGVSHAVPFGEEPHLIMDIGGGSVEFIIADNKNIFWKKSFEIGASRLLQRFEPNDPMVGDEVETIEDYLEEELSLVWTKAEKYQTRSLTGASGSFESLAAIDMELYHSTAQTQPFVHYILDVDHFLHLSDKLIYASKRELEQMPGLPPFRIEMISIACIMIRYVVQRLRIRKLIVSDYALKEGVMFRIIKGEKILNTVTN